MPMDARRAPEHGALQPPPLRAEAIKARGDDLIKWLDGGPLAGQACGRMTATPGAPKPAPALLLKARSGRRAALHNE
jgi:hypothetical protein